VTEDTAKRRKRPDARAATHTLSLLRQERDGTHAAATPRAAPPGNTACDAVPRVSANEERSDGGGASPPAFTFNATPGVPAAPAPKRPRAKSAPKPSVCPNMLVLVRCAPGRNALLAAALCTELSLALTRLTPHGSRA
jgi:hypothetical protein